LLVLTSLPYSTRFRSQRLGFATGLLALGDGQGFLLTLQCQIVLQHSQLVRAFIQLLFSLGNFSLQLDALQIGGGVVHRVLTVLGDRKSTRLNSSHVKI